MGFLMLGGGILTTVIIEKEIALYVIGKRLTGVVWYKDLFSALEIEVAIRAQGVENKLDWLHMMGIKKSDKFNEDIEMDDFVISQHKYSIGRLFRYLKQDLYPNGFEGTKKVNIIFNVDRNVSMEEVKEEGILFGFEVERLVYRESVFA